MQVIISRRSQLLRATRNDNLHDRLAYPGLAFDGLSRGDPIEHAKPEIRVVGPNTSEEI